MKNKLLFTVSFIVTFIFTLSCVEETNPIEKKVEESCFFTPALPVFKFYLKGDSTTISNIELLLNLYGDSSTIYPGPYRNGNLIDVYLGYSTDFYLRDSINNKTYNIDYYLSRTDTNKCGDLDFFTISIDTAIICSNCNLDSIYCFNIQ